MDLLYESELDVTAPYAIETVQAIGQNVGLKRKEQYRALRCLLANLYIHRGRSIGVPRSRNTMLPARYNPLRVGAASLVTALDGLATNGFVDQKIGSASVDPALRSLTTVTATKRLLTVFQDNDWAIDACSRRRPEIIRLKDADHKLTDYVDSPFTVAAREYLQDYCSLLDRTALCLDSPSQYKDFDQPRLRRTFLNNSFWQGGRIYGPWCQESSTERAYIRIEQKPTVEIDYPASHVNVLYLLETGARLPEGEDPYEIVLNGLSVDRATVKKSVSIALNSYSSRGFANSVAKNVGSGLRPSTILSAFLDKHPAIAHHYLRGPEHGNLIQFYESEILMNVIRYFTTRSIPILTIYDSVCISEEHHDALRRVMFGAECDEQFLSVYRGIGSTDFQREVECPLSPRSAEPLVQSVNS